MGIRHQIKKTIVKNPRHLAHSNPPDITKNGKTKTMDFTTFVRKPFVVDAVEITPENIEEVAKYVGDVREKEDGTRYILVDERLVPNVPRVYTGYFMTKMGNNIRCYSRKIFREQFTEHNELVQPWLDFIEAENHQTDTGEYGRVATP